LQLQQHRFSTLSQAIASLEPTPHQRTHSMRETPAKYKFRILVGGVAPTIISVRWGRPREIQRPCRALTVRGFTLQQSSQNRGYRMPHRRLHQGSTCKTIDRHSSKCRVMSRRSGACLIRIAADDATSGSPLRRSIRTSKTASCRHCGLHLCLSFCRSGPSRRTQEIFKHSETFPRPKGLASPNLQHWRH